MCAQITVFKREIKKAIKDLDESDYIDICKLIKSNLSAYPMVNVTICGTYIDIDQFSDEIIIQLHNMITTKLHRIAER